MKKVKLLFGIIAMICLAMGFSSCKKEFDLQNSKNSCEINNENDFIDLAERTSLANFGANVSGWTKVKTGNNVVLYQNNNNSGIYIADVNLTEANIGLLFGNSNIISNPPSWLNPGCREFQKDYVSGFSQNETNCFLTVNFGFFHYSGYNYTMDPSSYPFKQGSFVEIGGSSPNGSDYGGNISLFTMVFDYGYGVKLDNFSSNDWQYFASIYANKQKAYVIRNDIGNSPNSSTSRRTILAFTTKTGNYYKRMYIFVTSAGMKEGDTSNPSSGTAKRYIKDFIESQQQACIPIVYCPLDGGGSTQLYVNGSPGYSITSSRAVINALIVKDY
ncbi:hypothetical protein J5751_02540 [bacterium]|nr:hypothetical protein [bacterium]